MPSIADRYLAAISGGRKPENDEGIVSGSFKNIEKERGGRLGDRITATQDAPHDVQPGASSGPVQPDNGKQGNSSAADNAADIPDIKECTTDETSEDEDDNGDRNADQEQQAERSLNQQTTAAAYPLQRVHAGVKSASSELNSLKAEAVVEEATTENKCIDGSGSAGRAVIGDDDDDTDDYSFAPPVLDDADASNSSGGSESGGAAANEAVPTKNATDTTKKERTSIQIKSMRDLASLVACGTSGPGVAIDSPSIEQAPPRKTQPLPTPTQPMLREKELWRRRRKQREEKAATLREKKAALQEQQDHESAATSGDGMTEVSVPASSLSVPATEVMTNRSSDLRRNLWLDKCRDQSNRTAGGVVNQQESEGGVARDGEAGRLTQPSDAATASSKPNAFAPAPGRATPVLTEVGASSEEGEDTISEVRGVKVERSRTELNSVLGSGKKGSIGKPPLSGRASRPPPQVSREIDTALGGLPPTPKRKVSPRIGAAQKLFAAPPSVYRSRNKSMLDDDISHDDSSAAPLDDGGRVSSKGMSGNSNDGEHDFHADEASDTAEPLPPGFSAAALKTDVSLTSSTDVELGVVEGTSGKEKDLTGKSFTLNSASRNTGKKKQVNSSSGGRVPSSLNGLPTVHGADNFDSSGDEEVVGTRTAGHVQVSSTSLPSTKPPWAQVKLRKTTRGSQVHRQKPNEGAELTRDKTEVAPPPAKAPPVWSSPPETSNQDSKLEGDPLAAPTTPPRPKRVVESSSVTSPKQQACQASTVGSQTPSSVDWNPAPLSPSEDSRRGFSFLRGGLGKSSISQKAVVPFPINKGVASEEMDADDDVQIPVLERGGGATSIHHGNPSGRVVENISVQRRVTMFTKETSVSQSRKAMEQEEEQNKTDASIEAKMHEIEQKARERVGHTPSATKERFPTLEKARSTRKVRIAAMHNDLERSNSLTSENESVGVEHLRYKFESSPGRERGDGSDNGNIKTIRSRFEEMTSPQASGREGITTTRQLFEKSTPRDRAPNQIQMLDAMIEEYNYEMDANPSKGVQDMRTTFEPELKRFDPKKAARPREAKRSRPKPSRQEVSAAEVISDDKYESHLEKSIVEVNKIRSMYEAKPDPPEHATATVAPRKGGGGADAHDIAKSSAFDGISPIRPHPREEKANAVRASPFHSWDQQSGARHQVYSPSPTNLATTSQRSPPPTEEDGVTLSPTSTIVSGLSNPSALLDHLSKDSSSENRGTEQNNGVTEVSVKTNSSLLPQAPSLDSAPDPPSNEEAFELGQSGNVLTNHPPPTSSAHDADNQHLWGNVDWTKDFVTFGDETDPFDTFADFDAGFNAFNEGSGTPRAHDPVETPPRQSSPLRDDSTANTPVRTNHRRPVLDELSPEGSSVRASFDTAETTSSVRRRLEEIKEARRARSLGLQNTTRSSSLEPSPVAKSGPEGEEHALSGALEPPVSPSRSLSRSIARISRIGTSSPKRDQRNDVEDYSNLRTDEPFSTESNTQHDVDPYAKQKKMKSKRRRSRFMSLRSRKG